jgi:hypothetical protein
VFVLATLAGFLYLIFYVTTNAPAWLKDNCSQDGGESKGDFV